MEPQPATIDKRQPSPPVKQDSEVTNDPPVHPYSNIPKACFAPAVSNKSTGPSTTSKGKEPSYRTVVPIQDPKIIDDVYKRAMKVPSVTISHEELLSLSPDLRQRHRDQVTLKCFVMNSMDVVSTNFASIMPFVEYTTLPHLFRSDSGLSGWNYQNLRNPVDYFLYVVSPV